MRPEKQNAAPTAIGNRANVVAAIADTEESSAIRSVAQRRLALKLVAGAGLSMAFATVVVALATGDGRPV